MKKILSVFIFILLLAGCSSELTFNEVEIANTNNNVRTFFESVEDTNGAHLYFDEDKVIYVMLNGKNVIEGENAAYFTDFSVDSDGKILNINYIEEKTKDYSHASLKQQVVYKIHKDKQYETIRSFKNGNELSFQTVSGN
ncbi:membrane lipoprotein lipid attachment site-containing protein [Sutcliffiella deserti]|uniref:membrane lipoprotein lipid attachment site-containing protein n=1 Tax=Sutcliffiella deserti TaxID=2875501 RepID=UPI001CBD3C5D|nr:membrane lipoprotein lipid attachment site-containing protein [Sutcliffiella deserti]